MPLFALGPPWLMRLARLFGLLDETRPCEDAKSAIWPAVMGLFRIMSLLLLAVLLPLFGMKLLPDV